MNNIFTPIRRKMIVLFLIAFCLTEVGREVYRPYIYRHEINDFGVADTLGNFFGALSIIFLSLSVSRITTRNSRIVIAVVVLGLILYEWSQFYLATSSFDWKDIIATLLSGVAALLIVRKVMPVGHGITPSA